MAIVSAKSSSADSTVEFEEANVNIHRESTAHTFAIKIMRFRLGSSVVKVWTSSLGVVGLIPMVVTLLFSH